MILKGLTETDSYRQNYQEDHSSSPILSVSITGKRSNSKSSWTEQDGLVPETWDHHDATRFGSTISFSLGQLYRATYNLTMPHKTLPCHIRPHQATQNHIKQSLSCPSVRACGLDLSCIRTRSVRSKEASPPAGLDIRTRVDLIMDLYTVISYLILGGQN